jgi:hypothetical protein
VIQQPRQTTQTTQKKSKTDGHAWIEMITHHFLRTERHMQDSLLRTNIAG